MSVYTARKTTSTATSPAPFFARNLHGYSPAPISALGIFGVSHYREIAYAAYRQYIDAFCYATVTGSRVFAQAIGFRDLYGTQLIRPSPSVVFSPAVKINDDIASTLLGKLGYGASMRISGRSREFTIPAPTPSILSAVHKIHNANYGTSPSTISPNGYRAYQKICTLVDAFLATNYYPAFKDLVAQVPDSAEMEISMTGVVDEKKREYFYHYTQKLKRDSDEVAEANASVKRRRLEKERGDTMDLDDVTAGILPDGTYGVMNVPLKDAVVTAKPSGRPSSINFGPAGSCPDLPGIVFPYFHGLIQPDTATLKEVTITHFLRLFGASAAEYKANILDFKIGCGSLATTKTGMELTHMMKGIDLALQTQTRLYIVIEGSGYQGFVLLGGRFSVFDGSTWKDPVPAEDLLAELDKLDTHRNALRTICEKLSAIDLRSGGKAELNMEEMSSSAVIATEILRRDVEHIEDTEELDRALRSLMWREPFRVLGPDTFLSMLSTLENRDSPLPTTFYIPASTAPLEDRLFRLLASFGPDAPSLWNTRGTAYSCVKVKATEGGATRYKDPECPKELIILAKPLMEAYGNWKDKVLKTRSISMNMKERAKEYRGHVITNEEKKLEIWSSLVGILAHQEAPEKQDKKGKGKAKELAVDETNLLSFFD